MGKRIIKIILWTFGIVVLLLGLSIGFLFWKQDQIKALVIESLNANLNGEIKVAEAAISLRKFPSAAIELRQVLARGSNDLNDTLFQVESLFLEFGLWDIFGEEIPLQALSLENGDLHLVQKGSVNNWSIFKASEEEGEFQLSIAALSFKDMRFDYRKDDQFFVQAYAAEALAAGQFSSANWQLDLSMDAYVDAVEYEKESFLSFPVALSAKARLEGAAAIDLKISALSIDQQAGFQAHYNSAEAGQFSLEHAGLDLEESLALYRELGYPFPEDLRLQGKSQAQLKLLNLSEGELRLELALASESLKLSYPDWPSQTLHSRLEYYRQGKFDRLEIRKLEDPNGELQLQGTVRQLQKPNLEVSLRFAKEADFWQAFLQRDFNMSAGKLSGALRLKGQFNDWKEILSDRLNASQVNGSLRAQSLDLALPDGSEFESLNAKLRFRNRSIFVDSLHCLRGASDLYLEGELRDLWSYLFTQNGVLAMRAQLRSEQIQLEDFLSEDEAEADSSGLLAWKERLRFGLQVDIADFKFRNFQAKNLGGSVEIDRQGIRGSAIHLLADQGAYQGDFRIDESAQGLDFSGNLAADKVDVHSVFRSFDNFDQQTITADNLAGRLSFKAAIEAPLSKDLRLDLEGLQVQSEMTIEEGHLKNYEPMQALSRFAEVEELQDVSFKTLKNTISIAQGEIQIPEMAIASNVLNLDLSGSHSFENEINYLVKLRLSDVLFSKSKKSNRDQEFEEHLAIAKRDDDHRIPVSIKGTVDDPQISIDASALGDALEEDLRKQKEDLKNIFKKEETQKDTSTGLIFEWDDGAPSP